MLPWEVARPLSLEVAIWRVHDEGQIWDWGGAALVDLGV